MDKKFILENKNIILPKTIEKLEILGSELYKKTNVSVYVCAIDSTNTDKTNTDPKVKQSLLKYSENLVKDLHKPFILLILAKNDKKVDIISSSDIEGSFGKEEILSPYPWTGTILPILSAKGDGDNISAAILNGYADICERVASNFGVKLDSAIGNDNKTTIKIIKYLIYFTIILVLILYFYRKFKK